MNAVRDGRIYEMPLWAVILAVIGLIALIGMAVWLTLTTPQTDWMNLQVP